MRSILLIGLFMILVTQVLNGQIYIQQGLSQNRISDHHLLEGKAPLYSSQFGGLISFRPYAKNKDFFLETGLMYNLKGYKQKLDRIYRMKFTYLTIPVSLNYQILPWISLGGGLEYSELFFTNIKKGLKTYNHHDLGITSKIIVFNDQPLGGFISCSRGLFPLLDYEKIDAQGNFNGSIHDLRTMSFTLGIRINIKYK